MSKKRREAEPKTTIKEPKEFGLDVNFPDGEATQYYNFDYRDDIIQIGDFTIQKNKDEKGKDAWSLEFDGNKSKMKEVAEKLANEKEISDDGSVKIALKKVTILGTGNIEFELESTEGRKNFSNESKFTITPNSVKISKDEIHVTKGLEVMDVTFPRNFPQLFLSGSQTSKILPREFLTSICNATEWFNNGRNDADKIQLKTLTNTNNTTVRFLKCGDNVFAVSRSKMRKINQIHIIKQQDESFKTVFEFQGDKTQRFCDFTDDPSSFFKDELGLVSQTATGTTYENDLTKNELKGSDESYDSLKTATKPNDDTDEKDEEYKKEEHKKEEYNAIEDPKKDDKNVIFTPRVKNLKPTSSKSLNDRHYKSIKTATKPEPTPEPKPEPTPEPATKIEQKDGCWVIDGRDIGVSYKGEKAKDGTKPNVVDGKYEGKEILASEIQPEIIEVDGKKVWKIGERTFDEIDFLAGGIDGKDSTVEINEDGNWVINGTDTGKKAESTPLDINKGMWYFGEKTTDDSTKWEPFDGPLYAVGGKAQNGANVIIQEDNTFAIQNSKGEILETGISAVAKTEEEEKDVLEEASAATQFELDGNNIIIKNGDFAEDKTVDCHGEKGKSTEMPGIDTMRHWEGTEYLAINSDGEMASKIERVDEDTIKIGDTEYKGFEGKEGKPPTEENLPTRSEDGYWVFHGEKSNLKVAEAHLTIDDGLWKHLTKDEDGNEVLAPIHSYDDEEKEIKASARGGNGEDGKSLTIDDKSKNWLVAGEDTSKPAVAQEKEKNKEEEKEEKKEEPNEKYKFSSAPLFYIGGLILGVLGILTGLGWLLALAALLFSTPKLTEGIVNDRKANFHKSSQTKKILKSRNKKLVPSFKKVKHASKEFGKDADKCKAWNTAFNNVQGKNATLSKEARKQIQELDLKTPLDALKKRQEKIDELNNYLENLQKDTTNGRIENLGTNIDETKKILDDLSESNKNMINNFEILAEAQTRSKYPDMPSQLLAAALDPFYETTPTTAFEPNKLKDNIQDQIKAVCGTHLEDQKDELQGNVQKGFNEIYTLLDSHDASSKRMDVDFNRSI